MSSLTLSSFVLESNEFFSVRRISFRFEPLERLSTGAGHVSKTSLSDKNTRQNVVPTFEVVLKEGRLFKIS